ncbi:MAG: autotransporter domain-containing protein [Elusimicrobiota bacterium]|nr:autotransporter domain-containing protein [Elusimicrobiota bacterium]
MKIKKLYLTILSFCFFLLSCDYAFCNCIDDGSGNFTCDVVSGTETETALSGLTLTKTGAGETVLTGVNNFISVSPNDAYITISEGTLSLVEADASLSGDFKLNLTGGTLKTEGEISFSNEAVLDGGSINVSGEDSVLSLTNTVSGTSLTKTGLGLLDLKTSNAYGGLLTINEGGIESNSASFIGDSTINNTDAFLSFVENSDNTFDSTISGEGTFIKEGEGLLTIGDNGNISSHTIISDGAIAISKDTNLMGSISIDKGSLIVTDDLILQREISFGIENTGVNVETDKTLTLSSGAFITAQGCDEFGRCSEVIKEGEGTISISSNVMARYYANTNIRAGTLEISSGNSLGLAGYSVILDNATLAIKDTTTIDNIIDVRTNTSKIDVSSEEIATLTANVTGGGTLTKSGGGTLLLDGGALTHTSGTVIEGGTLQGNSNTLFGDIQIDGGTNLDILQETDGSLSAVLSGLGAVNKSGEGILTLSATNHNFLGDMSVLEGSIKGGSQAITFDVNLASGTSIIFDQNCTNAACEYGNSISGAGNLVKTGSGLLVLTNTNTYSGGTYLQNTTRDSLGILFSSDTALGSGDIFISYGNLSLDQNQTVSTNKNFIFSGQENSLTVLNNSTYTVNGVLSGTSFTKLGSGELILNGVNTYTQGTQITEGTLSINAPEAIGSGILSITGGTFKPLDDMQIENNIYLSAASGQGGFLVGSGKTLTLNGIVSGGGTLNKSGAGTLELDYYNSYLGGVYVAEGLLKGNTENILGNIKIDNGAEVEFNQDFDGYYIGDINSAGTIRKTGTGILFAQEDDQLVGSLSVGTLNIVEGTFVAQSSLGGDAYVSNGAMLSLQNGGSGYFEASGTLGFSNTSDVDLKGDIVVKSGGNISLNIQEGANNTVNVKDTDTPSGKGSITIENGGKIDINATGVFASPIKFDFLTYSNSFNYSGALADIDVNIINNQRLIAELQDNNNTLSLLISRLLSNYAGLNGLKYNQKQIARAMDKASAAPSSDFENILNNIDALPLSHQPQALTQLGGFIYANLPNYFDRFKDNAYLRINRKPYEENSFSRNIWVQSVNNYADIKENENSEEIYNLSNGFAVGFDNYFESFDLTAGLFAGYARHDLKHNKTENLDGDEYQLGFYALKQGTTFDFKGALSAGYQSDEVERNITFARRIANSKVQTYSFNANIEAGVKIYNSGSFSLRPFVSITGALTQLSSFEETGADSINLSGSGKNVFATQGQVGISIEKIGKSFSYYADASVKQNLNNPEYALNISGQDYKIKSADIGALFSLNIGGVKRFSESFSIYANGGTDMNGNAQNYYLNAGLRSYW